MADPYKSNPSHEYLFGSGYLAGDSAVITAEAYVESVYLTGAWAGYDVAAEAVAVRVVEVGDGDDEAAAAAQSYYYGRLLGALVGLEEDGNTDD